MVGEAKVTHKRTSREGRKGRHPRKQRTLGIYICK